MSIPIVPSARLDHWNEDHLSDQQINTIVQTEIHPQLTFIRFSGCALTDRQLIVISEQLKKTRFTANIQTIDLSRNALTFKGMLAFADTFLQNVTLQVENLNLAENNIGFHGVEAIAELYSKSTAFPQICSLNLSSNDIRDDGLQVLLDRVMSRDNAVFSHLPLVSLNLAENEITDSGAKVLSKFLLKLKGVRIKLQKVDLCQNRITDSGAKSLLVGIKECPSLTQFLLLGNEELSDEVLGDIKAQLRVNSSFQSPDLPSPEEKYDQNLKNLYEMVNGAAVLMSDPFYLNIVQLTNSEITGEIERFKALLKKVRRQPAGILKNSVDKIETYMLQLGEFDRQVRKLVSLREQVARLGEGTQVGCRLVR